MARPCLQATRIISSELGGLCREDETVGMVSQAD